MPSQSERWPETVRLLFVSTPLYVSSLTHQLGSLRRSVAELKEVGLLCNDVADIAKQGYGFNYGLAEHESLVTLAAAPLRSVLGLIPRPQAVVFHHSYPSSASSAQVETPTQGFMPHAQYFPAALFREVKIDHLPYFGSFETGCTGLFSLIMTGSGLMAFAQPRPLVCITCDVRPGGSTFDSAREKILTSDCASGFVLGHEPRGFQVLGLSYYSTQRPLVPLVEIVKRTVQMVRELTDALKLTEGGSEYVLHFPNIFPSAWPMVTNYLRLTGEAQPLDGLFERAHCLSSDPIISLAARHRGQAGRIHVVVNFGSGLHLAVGLFREGSEL